MLTIEQYAYEAGLKATCEFWTLVMLVLCLMALIGTTIYGNKNRQEQVFCVVIAMVCLIIASFAYTMGGSCNGKIKYHEMTIQQQQKKTK